ncbi:hypothetical protein QMG83_12365 [Salinibacterium sp. G-O1]|uniref:hypothetical protein n=1 Tax=Salinibacterium sp. G-O1 TaxID=3046208 RepID=UPI0024BA4E51|nr:hypothetical protein [Salinibacterium sp. G-O1]MDJ0336020.1 hypothetical protein [Salinibacterium sp. G-O1]
MTRPNYDDIRTIPLPTDRELIPHVQVMLEQSLRRQVWIMFLDEHSRPLPILIPMDVDAEACERDSADLVSALSCVLLDLEKATIVMTLERPGPIETMDRDRRWLRTLREACVGSGMAFRGPFLLLGGEVKQVPPDDYVGIPWVYSPYDEYDDQGSF